MGPEQESQPDTGEAPAGSSLEPRRERRPGRGRGRRGRGRRPRQPREGPPPRDPEDQAQSQPASEPVPAVERPDSALPEAAPPREPAGETQSPIQKAIDEVNHIIEALRATLDEMEEVLETLELAERQKDADEQEIESLRRAVRSMHRVRDQNR